MQYCKAMCKLLMNKAIIDNKQTPTKLQSQSDNYPSNIGDLDSNIEEFILFYCNITSMLLAQGKFISESDKIALLLRSFLHVKDEVFREYME